MTQFQVHRSLKQIMAKQRDKGAQIYNKLPSTIKSVA